MRNAVSLLLVVTVAFCNIFLLCEGYYLELLKYNLEYSDNEEEAREFLTKYDNEVQKLNTDATLAEWNYYTNITEENQKSKSLKSLKVFRYFIVKLWHVQNVNNF